jgi:hypothetical protein
MALQDGVSNSNVASDAITVAQLAPKAKGSRHVSLEHQSVNVNIAVGQSKFAHLDPFALCIRIIELWYTI